jgi:glucosamine-6-phosphate deaminase
LVIRVGDRLGIRIRVFETADAVAEAFARDLARCVRRNPALVLGLATGRTSIPVYQQLVRLHERGRLDLSRVTTFNLDEFVGGARRDRRKYRAFMDEHLFARVQMPRARIHFLDGAARDLDAECRRYERAIQHAGGIDLQILGLGANGHIGFNEPGEALHAQTHRTRLREPTRRANAFLFGGRVAAVPREALSMGMATILYARRIVLLATASEKSRCVERMLRGPVTPRLPASFLQLHRGAEVWLDRAAASRL